jgi:hypothetical protein
VATSRFAELRRSAQIFQLAYVSHARVDLDAETVGTLLETARRNNHRDAITGLLLCGGGMFFQVLEGGRDAVEACFARIARDPRHAAVSVLLRTRRPRRVFGDWTMGYGGPDLVGAFATWPLVRLQDLAGEDGDDDGAGRGGEARPDCPALRLARAFHAEHARRTVH